MEILTLEDIKQRIELSTIFEMQENGFKAYSQLDVDVPPVGYLKQQSPKGSYHIKYGLIKDDPVWVMKLAGGPTHLPLNGMMMVISTETGKPTHLLQDNGYLTQLRTAIAGAISAKYMAPSNVTSIGVIGTGAQARLQVKYLKGTVNTKNIHVWGRNSNKANAYKSDMEQDGYNVTICKRPADVAKNSNLIITTTSAREPILTAKDIQIGTHITAMGADAPGKIELDPQIVGMSDIAVVDSKTQCIDHGEICHAYAGKLITDDKLIELGQVIATPKLARTNDKQITLVDLTGVAVQDIQIAKAILTYR